jgi:hypothetical protein
MPPQAAGLSCYSTDEEITSICADFLVGRRGFEPMAIALRTPRFDAGSLPGLRVRATPLDLSLESVRTLDRCGFTCPTERQQLEGLAGLDEDRRLGLRCGPA